MDINSAIQTNDWYKKNKCTKCRYYYICLGITDAASRADCDEIKIGMPYYGEEEPPRWGEMSYYRLAPQSDDTRLKRGE